MSQIRVASRYAKSLFDLAVENNQLDRVAKDVQDFLQLCKTHKGFDVMINSPVVPDDKKWNIITKLFGASFDKITMAFIGIVIRKRRDAVLEAIFMQFNEMVRHHKGIISATVFTAQPISGELLDQIRQNLERETSKQVELNVKLDETLIGGYVLKYGDRLVDASVSSQLRNLRNRLLHQN